MRSVCWWMAGSSPAITAAVAPSYSNAPSQGRRCSLFELRSCQPIAYEKIQCAVEPDLRKHGGLTEAGQRLPGRAEAHEMRLLRPPPLRRERKRRVLRQVARKDRQLVLPAEQPLAEALALGRRTDDTGQHL